MMKRTNILAILGTVGALAACTDSTAPQAIPVGSLSVTLAGAETGQFDVSGARPAARPPGNATFAWGARSPISADRYMISAYRGHPDGTRQDMITIDIIGAAGPGEHQAAGVLAMGISGAGGLPLTTYRITSGTVRVTTLTPTRIAGEFSASGIGGPFAQLPPALPTDVVNFTAGTFDVPIMR